MMRRGSRFVKGISPVIATVILTSIMLTIISVALFYSTSLIDMNRQTMEYEYAKEQLTYAASALEQVAFGTGGSRYIRFSLTSTRLSFLNSGQTLRVSVTPGSLKIYEDTPLYLQVCGGPLVTTSQRLIYPETGSLEQELSKLVVGAGEPIVVVYENFSGAACSYLVPRLRAFFSGQINVTVNGVLKRYNYYTLHIVKLKFGRLGGTGTIPVVFRSVNMTVNEYRFDNTNTLTLTITRGSASQTVTLTGPPSDGSVLVVKIALVDISTS
ncbi:MAG: hypothetical protein ACP5GL_04450 [Infirmifilum sp.]